MPDFVRRIVSGPKTRYVDPKFGYDLDLVYVTDRLIIMGWPASNIEALYRNRRKDVRKFLDAKHGEQYRIYNLCPCSENTYDADEFYGAVSRYPFPDHHPPPLSMIPMFVADITAFFAENPNNVAVIHCKAGKGRSGTMVCSYLLSLPILPPPPQSSRNCGNKHDRNLLEEKRRAKKKAADNKKEDDLLDSTTDNEQLHLVVPSDKVEEGGQDLKMKELTSRLDAVFEFHTSRRLKPRKDSSSSSNRNDLQDQKSMANVAQIDDSIEAVMARSDSDSGKRTSPIRPRKSMSNLVVSMSRKASRLGVEMSPNNEGDDTPPSRKSSNAKIETQSSPPRLGSKSMANLRALGACPAGTSRANLGNHLEPPVPPLPVGASLNRDQSLASNPWASTLSVDDSTVISGQSSTVLESVSDQIKSRSQLSIPLSPNRSTPEIGSPQESDLDTDREKSEEMGIPKLAVSIPSQRRWVGYWGRMLAGMDPRAALDSSLMHPSRRKVKIRQIYIDRRATNDHEEGHLSVQIARYNEQLIDRVETWERGARRRQRAFGAVDPGAPSPNLLPSEVEGGSEAGQKAEQQKDEDKRWRECEKRNRENQEEYNRMLRQHGNDTGVGMWGINVMAEREAIRHFHWDDEQGGLLSDQMEVVAMVSEQARFKLSKNDAEPLLSNVDLPPAKPTEEACILRYVFEPDQAASTHYGEKMPRMTWTKPSAAVGGITKFLQGALNKRNDIHSDADTATKSTLNLQPHLHSPSDASNDTWPSQLSTTPIESASSATSDEYIRADISDGVMIDADREVQLRILIGRSGATHAKLPDMLSAGYLWFIPAFETPTVNGKTIPKKGQLVKCQFGIGEIDFRKGKKAAPLMGGGDIRSVTVEFEWVEVGWHEGDEG